MNYNNLTDLEDRALGAFNGDTSEALDVQSLNSNWPFTAESSISDVLSGLVGRGLIQKTDNKYFLTAKGLQLWNSRSSSPPQRRQSNNNNFGEGLVGGLIVGSVIGGAFSKK
jgi:hypothetical protein